MEMKKTSFMKSAKFITLLLTSLLIATVSAATYFSLMMTSTVQVYQANVYFVVGSDNGKKGLSVILNSKNTTATLTGLRAYPNATFTYTNATLVKNSGGTASSIRLAPSAISGGEADFYFVKFLLNATNPADRRWLNYTSDSSTWTNTGTTQWTTLAATNMWPIVIMTKARSNATNGDTVTIQLTVDVD